MSLVSQDAALTECHLTKTFSKCQISGEQLFLHDWWRHLKPVIFLSLADQPPGLSVHDWCPGSGLLPAVVVLYQAGDQLVWKLQTHKKENLLFITCFKYLRWEVHVCLSVTHHLLDAVEALAVEAEGLLEKHLIFNCPLIWEGREVCQVGQWALHVVFVP